MFSASRLFLQYKPAIVPLSTKFMSTILSTLSKIATFDRHKFLTYKAFCLVRRLLLPVQKSAGLNKNERDRCIVEQHRQSDKKWYAVLTKVRSEESAQIHLNTKGIEVFHPKLILPIARSGRHIVSLFPNYLFVRIDASSSEYYQVAWCSGVKRLVGFGGLPSPVEDSVVDFIREQADPRGLIMAKSNLKVGDEVQITNGPFKGLIGIIQEPPDTRSRVKVLMALLSRHVQVEVPAAYINMGWVAPCPA
jgi:transcriptional antiterminator RfaH